VQAKYKFLLVILALTLPYLGFVEYFAMQFPRNHPAPTWFTDTLLVWFTANFLIAMSLRRWIFRGQVVGAADASAATANAARVSIRLIVLWILLFLIGAVETARGKIPFSRAIPAGASCCFSLGYWVAAPTARAVPSIDCGIVGAVRAIAVISLGIRCR
jgi:hypothetical protein